MYAHSSNRHKHHEDFFCLTPSGVRVGYASPRLLKTLPAHERRRFDGRVVWASTANPFYALGHVRPGTAVEAARKHLKLRGPFKIGQHHWYLAPHGASTAVLKTGHGKVEEIGIADKALTKSDPAQHALLKSLS